MPRLEFVFTAMRSESHFFDHTFKYAFLLMEEIRVFLCSNGNNAVKRRVISGNNRKRGKKY